MKSAGPGSTAVKIVFRIQDSDGNFTNVETEVTTISPEQIIDLNVNWEPLIGKYVVSARCWYDTVADGTPDTPGEKIKEFRFTVKE